MTLVFTPALQRLPGAFYFCLGALVALMATVLVYQHYSAEALGQRNREYGQALAHMAARQAVDATLNHDLVSLQVILRDTARNPGVASATIHDVENRLLVQAGTPSRGGLNDAAGQTSFAAPITLQDSVAGYVTVNLDLSAQGQANLVWGLAAAGLILVAVAVAILYRETVRPPASLSVPVVDTPHRVDKVTPQRTEFPAQYHSSILTLYSANLEQLRQQLSGQTLKQLLDQLERQITGVIALYNGELLSISGNQFQLAFYSKVHEAGNEPENSALDESAFHAVCAALLLLGLHTANRSSAVYPLLNAAITPAADPDQDLYHQYTATEQTRRSLEVLQQRPPNVVLIAEELLTNSGLEQRFSFHPRGEDTGFASIKDIREPYFSLLEKQRQQLNALKPQREN